MRVLLVIAYVDPSAGSALLQALLAGLTGAALVVKLAHRRLRTWFSRRRGFGRNSKPSDEPPT